MRNKSIITPVHVNDTVHILLNQDTYAKKHINHYVLVRFMCFFVTKYQRHYREIL